MRMGQKEENNVVFLSDQVLGWVYTIMGWKFPICSVNYKKEPADIMTVQVKPLYHELLLLFKEEILYTIK